MKMFVSHSPTHFFAFLNFLQRNGAKNLSKKFMSTKKLFCDEPHIFCSIKFAVSPTVLVWH